MRAGQDVAGGRRGVRCTPVAASSIASSSAVAATALPGDPQVPVLGARRARAGSGRRATAGHAGRVARRAGGPHTGRAGLHDVVRRLRRDRQQASRSVTSSPSSNVVPDAGSCSAAPAAGLQGRARGGARRGCRRTPRPDRARARRPRRTGVGGLASQAGDALAAAGLLVEVLLLHEVQDRHVEVAAGLRGPVQAEELGDEVLLGEDDRLAAVDLRDLGGEGVDRVAGRAARRWRWRRSPGAPRPRGQRVVALLAWPPRGSRPGRCRRAGRRRRAPGPARRCCPWRPGRGPRPSSSGISTW